MASATFPTVPAELTPHYTKTITNGNFIDFSNASFSQWLQPYMPEIYDQEVERYGNRTLSGFLSMAGAEEALESDQVIWSEQGRLHLSYEGAAFAGDSGGQNVITIAASGTHAVRVGQNVLVTDGSTTVRCHVTAIASDNTTLTVRCYTNSTGLADAGLSGTIDFFVFGSDFKKGTAGMQGSLTPDLNQFNNRPIILKDNYTVSGSDMAQIGWIDISGEDGQSGYMWYLKGEGDTRSRFDDYLEMSLLEAVKSTNSSLDVEGTEGFFSAVENRGIIANNMFDVASEVIGDFDLLLKQLDKQGNIEENMLYLDRDASLSIDSGLATANSYGTDGTSYGLFNNSEQMALNLGFNGFRRGSYDFYKTDWKYLNDPTARGLVDDIDGALVPAGVTTVYDQQMGKNMARPFLHVRYRASGSVNRRMVTRVLGLDAGTNDIDETSIEMLSERCLVTLAANNFVLFK